MPQLNYWVKKFRELINHMEKDLAQQPEYLIAKVLKLETYEAKALIDLLIELIDGGFNAKKITSNFLHKHIKKLTDNNHGLNKFFILIAKCYFCDEETLRYIISILQPYHPFNENIENDIEAAIYYIHKHKYKIVFNKIYLKIMFSKRFFHHIYYFYIPIK